MTIQDLQRNRISKVEVIDKMLLTKIPDKCVKTHVDICEDESGKRLRMAESLTSIGAQFDASNACNFDAVTRLPATTTLPGATNCQRKQ